MAEPTLTPYQLIKLQMEYAVPLIRDLQAILGEETVNKALEQRLPVPKEFAALARLVCEHHTKLHRV